jgi:hypothetical protein
VIDVALELRFGSDGNSASHLGPGWSEGEDGFRWMVGAESDLWFEHPGPGCECILELALVPFVSPPEIPCQRLMITVRGFEIGVSVLTCDMLLGYVVPAAALAAPGPVRVRLVHPDARPPNEISDTPDDRPLAIALRTARLSRMWRTAVARPADAAPSPDNPPQWSPWAGGLAASQAVVALPRSDLPRDELALRFESLGDNCELGLIQRRCGVEPLSLLRFSNIELPSLIRGINSGFAGLGDLATLQLLDNPDDREYAVRDVGYGITYHTFLYKEDVTADGLLQQQATRLKFLVRKLLEDMREAEKIFVVKRNEKLTEATILPLYAALNLYGDNTLLWVTTADGQHPAGTVERRMPGLLKGYVDRFAPYDNAHDLSFESWVSVCRRAHRIGRR